MGKFGSVGTGFGSQTLAPELNSDFRLGLRGQSLPVDLFILLVNAVLASCLSDTGAKAI